LNAAIAGAGQDAACSLVHLSEDSLSNLEAF
jgi:hypothetical protein